MQTTEILPTKKYYYSKTDYDPVRVFDTISRMYIDFENKVNKETLNKQYSIEINKENCYITHRDSFYSYGGSKNPNQISKIDCRQSQFNIHNLKFNFTGGSCASNNKNVLLCFPTENKRLCYKSNSPIPRTWWQWFTYVEFSFARHNAISLTSGNLLTFRK